MAILAPDPEPVVESPPIMEREPTSEAPTPPLGRPVSMYKNAFSKEPKDVALGNVLVAIRNGRWGDQVRALRALLAHNREAYDREKRALPAFAMSGTAATRKGQQSHTGLIQVDLDHLGSDLPTVRELVQADPHVAFGYVSPSGEGLKLGLRIDPERHEESFAAAEVYFRECYGREVDKKVKDRLRLCFVSHDPDLWVRENALPLPIPELRLELEPKPKSPRGHTPVAAKTPAPPDTEFEHGAVLILPSGPVTFSEAAREIFSRFAPIRTLFWRGGALVERVDHDGVSGLEIVRPEAFRSRVEKIGTLMAWRVGEDGEPTLKPARMPRDDATALMATTEARELLPPIASVLRCPVLIEKDLNTVSVLGEGYHPQLGGLLIVAGEAPPQFPPQHASLLLSSLIDEFDFQSPGDRSRALAAFLTPALRMGGHLKGSVPIDCAEADQSQSGKGYRHHLVAALYGESAYFVTSRQGGVGSVDESFAAALISGRPFICLDNFRGRLDSQHLEAFLTCPTLFPARVPHRGEVMIDPKRFLLQMSSNGLEATRDLANRASICRIRKRPGFKYRDTLGELQQYQSTYLGAVFSLVTAWVAAGKPRTDETRHDFREWCQVVDWIVQNLMGGAPVMEGHPAAQERVANPALVWVRSIALALEGENRLGESLTATAIVEICSMHDIAIPGSKDQADGDMAKRQVGSLLRRVFREAEEIEVDGFTIRRSQQAYRKPSGDGDTMRTYTFERTPK
jgi:hypothetical protein